MILSGCVLLSCRESCPADQRAFSPEVSAKIISYKEEAYTR